MNEEINEIPIVEQKSSFKLIRNTKGFSYEIKVYGDTIEEIEKNSEILHKWAEERYPRTE